jgi:hypothetical protein
MLLLLAILRAHAEPSRALMEAAEAELARASKSLRLPNQPAPYFISYEVIDGDVATTMPCSVPSQHEPRALPQPSRRVRGRLHARQR